MAVRNLLQVAAAVGCERTESRASGKKRIKMETKKSETFEKGYGMVIGFVDYKMIYDMIEEIVLKCTNMGMRVMIVYYYFTSFTHLFCLVLMFSISKFDQFFVYIYFS